MFSAASHSLDARHRGWSLQKTPFAAGSLRATPISPSTADLRAKRGQIVLLEAKSPCDTLAAQQAICQQFHWLLSSQIHFRRTERAS